MTTDKYEIKARIMAKDVNPSAEALARKERSVARLKQEGVPIVDHLPAIDDSQSVRRRTAEEIARRAIALCLVAWKGTGLEHDYVHGFIKFHGAQEFFSPEERAFIENPTPSQRDRINFSWRFEAYWVMLWALGYIESLGYPEAVCDVDRAVGILQGHATESFISAAKLRNLSGILDEADLIYRHHWAVVDARLKKQPSPARLDGGVVLERHRALNWLIGYMDQEWDDVTTDT